MKEMVSLAEFQKLDFHVGRILEAEPVEGSGELLVLKVSLGKVRDSDESETADHIRQVVAGLGRVYDCAALIGRQVVVLANLKPRLIMGVESQGMLIAVDDQGQPTLLQPEKPVTDGAILC